MRHFSLCSLVLLLALLLTRTIHAQNFEGQWKGTFTTYDSTESDEYVLELQKGSGNEIGGFSYTYFYERGQRYFTICKVIGTVDPASRTVTVTEVERIKGINPPGTSDCFQTHTLTYFKGPDGETLEGKWKPAPGFGRNCGFGTTSLSRRLLSSLKTPKTLAGGRTRAGHVPEGTGAARKTVDSTARATRRPPAPKPATGPATGKPSTAATRKPAPANKPRDSVTLKMQSGGDHLSGPPTVSTQVTPPPPQVRQRQDNVIQTIDLSSPEIKIEIYDDGIIDHDTVTVYFNGKAVVYKSMISHDPIRVTLRALPDRDNDLILYADNLGDIPPNTALMVVHVGDDQYDVRVTSDLEHNGVVRFRLKQEKKP